MSNPITNKYEEAVFKFFTEPENFETMIRVNEHADRVIKKVITDFWDGLLGQLKEEFKKKESDWVVRYSGDIEEKNCKLWIYRESWLNRNDRDRPIFAVAFENLHLGEKPFLGISPDAETKSFNQDILRSTIHSMPEIDNYTKNFNKWWACWTNFSIDFIHTIHLRDILPENRSSYITEFANEAIRLAEILDVAAEDMILKAKL